MFSSKPILDKLFDIEAIFGNKLGRIYIFLLVSSISVLLIKIGLLVNGESHYTLSTLSPPSPPSFTLDIRSLDLNFIRKCQKPIILYSYLL